MANLFRDSYPEARRAFLASAAASGASFASVRAPGRGPEGEPLFLDTALVGEADARVRLVVSSGLHGIEGYCGSACQSAWLASGVSASLPPQVSILFVHALNPYGFAWGRRFNEDNVDLNRNFLSEPWSPPYNSRYPALRAALAADPTDPAMFSAAQAALDAYRMQEGEAAYTEAVAGGQYEDAGGVFFGGRAPAWTHRTYVSLLRQALAGAERAVIFDIHTGIGSFGELVAFCMTGPDDPRVPLAEHLFGIEVRLPAPGPDGGRARRGLMLPFLDDLALAPFVLPVGIEFGTYPLALTTAAVCAENWLHLHGRRDSAEGRRVRAAMRQAFSPRDPDWEGEVMRKAPAIFRRMIETISEW